MTNEDRTIFQIPAENYDAFVARIGKMSKQSVKLGFDPIKPFVFSTKTVEQDGKKRLVYEVFLRASVAKISGWTFMAALDHYGSTNIIRSVPNSPEVPSQFRTTKSTCDHCGVSRNRRTTYVLLNDETGEFKQVGSSCLVDFFGHDPAKVAKLAEVLASAYGAGRSSEDLSVGQSFYPLADYLVYVAHFCRAYGWVSSANSTETEVATFILARSAFMDGGVVLNEEDRQLAEDAIAAAKSITEPKNSFEHNLKAIVELGFIEDRSFAIAAAIVGPFFVKRRRETNQKQNIGSFEGVLALMKTGGERLQYPKIRLQTEQGHRVVLSVAGAQSKAPGTVNVTDGGSFESGTWYGRVTPAGEWMPSGRVSPNTQAGVAALLTALAANPAATASRYGKLTGQCCFCARPLSDKRSLEVGYGGTCAKNYQLPW